jgi:hypothetical protein
MHRPTPLQNRRRIAYIIQLPHYQLPHRIAAQMPQPTQPNARMTEVLDNPQISQQSLEARRLTPIQPPQLFLSLT